MKESIRVIVESAPTDPATFWISIVSGIFIPLVLLFITVYMTRKAEDRSRRYADQIRMSNEKSELLRDYHDAIDNLYKSAQTLRHNNLKRKRHEGYASMYLESNDLIREKGSNEALKMNHDLLKWQSDKLIDLEAMQGLFVVDLESARVRVEVVLSEEYTKTITEKVNIIRANSVQAGGITEEMMSDFVSEMNKLTRVVESNPEIWLP